MRTATDPDAREMPHLALVGEVSWRVQGRRVPLPSGRPASIGVLLAQSQPRSVRVDAIIDRLWQDAPGSGANAVQRHVCTLRRSLREHGLPEEAIETTADGYRLHPEVTTDSQRLDELLRAPGAELPEPDAEEAAVAWWLEPLPGIEWEPHAVFHSLLCQQCVGVASRWAELAIADGRNRRVSGVLASLVQLHEHEPVIWSLLQEAAETVGNRELIRAAAVHTGPRSPTSVAGNEGEEYVLLESCIGRWRAGNVDGACEELEAVSPYLSEDVARRAERCLVLLSNRDRLAEKLWSLVGGQAPTQPELAERAMVSLDAYALEQLSDGLELCDAEVERTTSIDSLIRALRTRFMVGMTRPLTDAQEAIPERLAGIDSPDAQVEAHRFRVLLETKRNRIEAALRELDSYERCVGEWWPDSGDTVAPTARFVLRERLEQQMPANRLVARREVVDMVATWRRFENGEFEASVFADCAFHGAMAGASPVLAAAMRAMRTHGADAGLDEVIRASLVEARPGRHHHAALVVLGWVAVTTRDAALAQRVGRQLLPWADEQLGLWPLHALLGSAESLISELACRQAA